MQTVAGNGTSGSTGDGSLATNAEINSPSGVGTDSAGNIYFTDSNTNAVRKITVATGIITTVAGNGSASFSGDGGAATSASLNSPFGLAVDGTGNLYIADSGNNRIRKVTAATGLISTVAGNGTSGFAGDGGLPTSAQLAGPQGVSVDGLGNLYIADSGNNRIREVAAATGYISTIAGNGTQGFTGDSGQATSAELNNPIRTALDSFGDLFIPDSGNNRVRKVVLSSGIITTVAGNGTAGSTGDGSAATSGEINNPRSVTCDSFGNLYISEFSGNRIREVNAGTGIISTFVGTGTAGYGGDNGPATSAEINTPRGIVFDNLGSLFIADSGTYRIRKVATNAAFYPTAIGSSSTPQTLLLRTTATETISSFTVSQSQSGKQEYSVGTSSGCTVNGSTSNASGTICMVPVTFNPAYPDLRNIPLTVVTGAGTITIGLSGTGTGPLAALMPGIMSTVAGNGSGGSAGNGGVATSAQVNNSAATLVDSAGNLYIADRNNNEVRVVSASTGIITAFAGTGTAGYSGDGGAANSAQLSDPEGLAMDSAGDLYISETGNNRIRRVAGGTGIITTYAGNGTAGFTGDGGAATSAEINNPVGIALDSFGNLYIADSTNNRIRFVNASTGFISTVAGGAGNGSNGDGGAATSAQLSSPDAVFVDASGNIYIGDHNNNKVRKVTMSTGVISTFAGTGTSGYSGDGGQATAAQLNSPWGVVQDSAGNTYISGNNDDHIRLVNAATGVITTIAGNGSGSYSGDGGAATSAAIRYPEGLSLSSSGNLYIADAGNNRVREVTVNQSALSFPTATPVGEADGTDDPRSVTLENIGNAALTITPPSSGTNPSVASNFVLDSATTCPQLSTISSAASLASGATCTYAVDFEPTTTGSISGSAIITDNSLANAGTTQTIALTGTSGADSTATVVSSSANPSTNGTSVTFTSTLTDSSVPATTPTGTVQFNIDGTNVGSALTLSGGTATYTTYLLSVGTHSVYAVYTPGSSSFSTSTSSTLTQTVNAASSAYTAPTTNVGSTSTTQTATVNITTAGTLSTISVLTQGVSGLDFAFVTGGTCATGTSYTVGQACTVQYTFGPQASGNRYGAVLLKTAAPALLGESFVYGVGNGPAISFPPGIVSTIAGNGTQGETGNGAAAASAELSQPAQVTVDATGNIYISDLGANTVRKISAATGYISTVAGNGTQGYSGDGGAATSASFYSPNGLGIDGAGNLYITDQGNCRLRMVSALTGIVSTVAGNGTCGHAGDGAAATSANVAAVAGPIGFNSSGNLYFADGNYIRSLNVSTGIISTVAGTGSSTDSGDGAAATSAGINLPSGVAFDSAGNYYVTEYNGNRVRKITQSTGYISTVAGTGTAGYSGDGGPATSAAIYAPNSLAVDPAGNIYISAYGNDRARVINSASGIISTMAGNGTNSFSGDGGIATSATFYGVSGVTLDGTGNVYIADRLNNRVRKVNASSAPSVSLPSTTVGATSTATNQTVENIGNSSLTISSISVPTNFSLGGAGTTCTTSSQTLASSATCVLGIEMVPTVVGSLTGNLTLTDNTLNGSSSTQSLALSGTATKGTPTITWATPSAITYGTALSATQLNATASVPGTFVYSPASGTVLNAGSQTLSVTFTPTDTTDYNTNTGSVTLTVNQASKTITFPQPSTPAAVNSSATLTATSSSGDPVTYSFTSGTATISGSTITYTNAGIVTIAANSAASTNYSAATAVSNSVAVNAAATAYTAPSTNVGSTSATQTATVNIATAGTLNTISVLTQGVSGFDFAFVTGGTCSTGTAYTVGQACTVQYSFAPLAPGNRYGAVVLTTSAPALLGQSFLYGVGTGPAVSFPPGIVSTVAGNGTQGETGNGAAATSATLNQPDQMAIDGAGNLYIADSTGNTVRKVSATTGYISLVAGNGTQGYTGDGGAATSAELYNPLGVSIDGAGNLYISDYTNCRIRKVNAITSVISTVAGTGTCSYSGDGGLATSAAISRVSGQVGFDSSGNLYIPDSANYRVRMVNISTGIISTVGGTGSSTSSGDGGAATSAGINVPVGVVFDTAGNWYTTEYSGARVRKVSKATGYISTIVGNGSAAYSGDGGLATSAQISQPNGVVVDSAGNVYIADTGNARVRVVNGSTGIITTTAGTGTNAFSGDGGVATSAAFNSIGGVALDSAGNLYVMDRSNNRVRKVNASSAPSLSLPSTTVGATSAATNQTVENIGNSSLTISSISVPTNFSLGGAGTTCTTSSQTLASSATCVLGIEMVPTVVGSLTGNLTLTDNTLNGSSATQSLALSGTATKGTPTITWATPSAITYGTALSATQLNATASVPGTFVYSPVSGTVLNAGSQTLSVTFTPTDTTDYNTNTGSVTLIVNQASKTITFPQPSTPVAVNGTATLTATSSSGDAVTYTVTSGTATISGSTITYTNAGTVTIAANSAASTNYSAAATVSDSVTVTAAATAYTAPTTNVGSTSTTQTATVNITTAGTLSSISVVTQGATGLDYAFVSGGTCATGTAYTVGQACTVEYSFAPTAPGRRLGAINLFSVTPILLGTSYLASVGNGPMGLFTTPSPTTISSSISTARGISLDGSGNMYVSAQGTGVVYMITPGGTTSAIATISGASATAVDGAGNLFMASGTATGTNLYERLAGSTTVTGIASISGSVDNTIVVDGSGNLYFESQNTHNVYQMAAGTHALTQLLTGGQAVPGGTLGRCIGMAIDASGNLYLADYSNNALYKVTQGTWAVTTLARADGALNSPQALGIDPAGNLYVSMTSGNVVRYAAGTYANQSTLVGYAGCCTIALDSSGNIYLGGTPNSSVFKYTRTATPTLSYVSTAVGNTSADQIEGFENDGNAALTFTSLSGSNASFNSTDTKCSISSGLAAGGSCNLGISFAPSAAGSPLTGSANITNNNLNSSGTIQQIAISGTATGDVTATVVSSSSNPSTFGGSLTFTATVSNSSNPTTPSGTVQFKIDGSNTGSAITITSGSASFTTSSLTAGSHTVIAVFTPASTSFLISTSSAFSQTVTKVTPTVSWANPSVIIYGTALSSTQLNATASVPGTFVYTPALGTVLSAGSQTLSVIFTPTDTVDYNIVSQSATLTVNQAMVSISGNSSIPVASYGDSVTLSFVFLGGGITPTGTTTIKDGGTVLGTVPLTLGVATLSTSTLAAGIHTITAIYNGDSNYH